MDYLYCIEENNLTALNDLCRAKKSLELLTSLADVSSWQHYDGDAANTQMGALRFCQCSANLP